MIYRNRRVGDFLKDLRLTEGRNMEFPTVFTALKENGSGLPTFEMDEGRGYLTVIIPVHPYFLPKNTNSLYEQKIIEILSKKQLTLTDLSKELGYKGITEKLRKTIDSMLKQGIIKKVPSTEKTVIYSKS